MRPTIDKNACSANSFVSTSHPIHPSKLFQLSVFSVLEHTPLLTTAAALMLAGASPSLVLSLLIF